MCAIICVLLFAAVPVKAQQRAPVLLGSGHWSEHALRRLYAAGLIGSDYDHAAADMTRSRLQQSLDTAFVRATARDDAMLPVIAAWRQRLSEEEEALRLPGGVEGPQRGGERGRQRVGAGGVGLLGPGGEE